MTHGRGNEYTPPYPSTNNSAFHGLHGLQVMNYGSYRSSSWQKICYESHFFISLSTSEITVNYFAIIAGMQWFETFISICIEIIKAHFTSFLAINMKAPPLSTRPPRSVESEGWFWFCSWLPWWRQRKAVILEPVSAFRSLPHNHDRIFGLVSDQIILLLIERT